MANLDLEFTGVVTNSGFTNPADVATSNDTRATGGDKNDFIIIDIDNAPGDYEDSNSGNFVILRIEGRHSAGTPTRVKQFRVELLDSSNVAVDDASSNPIQFTTFDLTDTDVDESSGLFTLPDNYLAADIDGWRLRLTSLEGGGMGDSITTEADWLRLVLDYSTAPPNQTLTPAPMTAAFNVPTPTVAKGPLTLAAVALIAAWSVPTPTVSPVNVLTPAAMTAVWNVPTPTVNAVKTLLPAPMTAAWSVNVPAINKIWKCITVKPSGGDYTDLDTALAAEEQDLTLQVGGLKFLLGDYEETNDVDIDGSVWKMDFDHQIHIVAESNHNGVWNTGTFRQSSSSAGSLLFIHPTDSCFVTIDGVQLVKTGSGAAGTIVRIGSDAGAGEVRIRKSILVDDRDSTSGTAYGIRNQEVNINLFVGNVMLIGNKSSNNIAISNTVPASNNEDAFFHNVTIDDWVTGLALSSSGFDRTRCRNTRITNVTNVFTGTDDLRVGSDNNLTDNATVPTNWGSNSFDSSDSPTIDYVDDTSSTRTDRDLLLASSSDTGFETGQDASVHNSLPITHDIRFILRTLPYDIGCHELSVSLDVILTPAAMTAAFSVPTPTVVTGALILTPAALSAAWNVPTPALNVVKTLAPAAMTAAWIVPTPTIGAVKTLAPAPTVAAWSVPTPTVNAVKTLSPTAIIAVWSVVAPDVLEGGVTLTPAAMTAIWSVVTPNVLEGGVTLAPAPVVANWVVPTPDINSGTTLSPAAMSAAWSVPTPIVGTGPLTLTPAAMSAIWSVVTPVIATGPFTIVVTPVTAAWSVVTPTIVAQTVLSATPVVATWVVPIPTIVTGPITLSPAAMSAAWSVGTPNVLEGGVTLFPSAISAAWSVVTPVVTIGGVTLTPSPVVAAWIVPTPVIEAGGVLTPVPMTASWSVPTPSIATGPVTLTPAAVTASWTVVVAVVIEGGIGLFGLAVSEAEIAALTVHPLSVDELRAQTRDWS